MLYNNDFEVLINSSTLSSWHWRQLIVLSHVSWGFSWSFVCWAVLGWSWIYEFYAMRLRVLLNSVESVATFVVAGARPVWVQIVDPCQPPAGFCLSCVLQGFVTLIRAAACVTGVIRRSLLRLAAPSPQRAPQAGICTCCAQGWSREHSYAALRGCSLECLLLHCLPGPLQFQKSLFLWLFSLEGGALFLLLCYTVPGT